MLMDLQQQQLKQLSDWLNQMEARINSHPPIGGSEQQVIQQLQTHKVCLPLSFNHRLIIRISRVLYSMISSLTMSLTLSFYYTAR